MKTGRINSIQSLGTVDGPGVRFTVFLQGCCLRCSCCHNPDTWDISEGKEYTSDEIIGKALRYREYFGKDGGLTFSGGEPLLQADFVCEVFTMCRDNGINTCLDTAGPVFSNKISELLQYTDRVLLDIKYTNEKQYLEHVGCSMSKPLSFLDHLESHNIHTTIRHVVIPTVNDEDASIVKICEIATAHKCVDSIELLPFHRMCSVKYDNLGIPFPFSDIPEPSPESMEHFESLISDFYIIRNKSVNERSVNHK